MSQLKDKIIENGYSNNYTDYFESKDVKEAVMDFNNFFKTILNENSITGLSDEDRNIIIKIMDKYNIEQVNRDISSYEHMFYIHKKIFGDFTQLN